MTSLMKKVLLRLREAREGALKSLYVHRPLVNTDQFLKWAKEQGFEKATEPDQLHVTVLYSKKPVSWANFTPEQKQLVVREGKREVHPLGDEGAVVLRFSSQDFQDRHREFRAGGGSHDYGSYKPHVTITYDSGKLDLSQVQPYRGPLVFGPEEFAVINKDWTPSEK